MSVADVRANSYVGPPPPNSTFDPADWVILAQFWYPIALSRDVAQAPVSATLLDEALVVYRAGDEVVVATDICPHRGVPLSFGTGDGQGVRCAPLDPRIEVDTAADRSSVAYRRGLTSLGLSHFFTA